MSHIFEKFGIFRSMRLMAVHAAQRVRADIQVGFLEGSLLIPVALTAQLRQRLCVKGGLA